MTSTATRSVVLLVGTPKWLGQVLELSGYVILEEPTGERLLNRLKEAAPDIVLIQDALPDASGIEACRRVREQGLLDRQVPVLVFTPHRPSPAQRVTGLRAGVWDFLSDPSDRTELVLKLEAYAEAKRSIRATPPRVGAARTDPSADALFDSPWHLVRRAHDLSAVLMRRDGELACVEFGLPSDIPRVEAGHLLVRLTRRSDVVGVWDPGGLTVLAPWVDHDGALRLALRVGAALRGELTRRGYMVEGAGLPAGYDAVSALLSTPVDPSELLVHAATALREGEAESRYPWIRRFVPSRRHGPAPAPERVPVLELVKGKES